MTTTVKSNDKVRIMLENIMKNKMYETYDEFFFFIISTEKQVLTQEKANAITCPKLTSFTFPVKNIININDLYGKISAVGENNDLTVSIYNDLGIYCVERGELQQAIEN